jgi:hypothetical protein
LTAKKIAEISRKIPNEKVLQVKSSQISYILDQSAEAMGEVMSKYGRQALKYSVMSDVEMAARTIIPKVSPTGWANYMDGVRKIINITSKEYIEAKSIIDGGTIKEKLKTIKEGTQQNVDDIMKVGFSEGKSSWQIAKEIENYIDRDKRKLWVTPNMIAKRAKGFPLSAPYTTKMPQGSVDYNALRIARTELMNNYRGKRIEATKGRDWVVGWRWVLSSSHPMRDICDEYAEHDEGLGKGVYSDEGTILLQGHPHCLCDVVTVTIYDSRFNSYFDDAYSMADEGQLSVGQQNYLRAAGTSSNAQAMADDVARVNLQGLSKSRK